MFGRLLLSAVAAVAVSSLSHAAAQRMPPPGVSDKNLKGESDGIRGRASEMERIKRDAEKPDRKSEKSTEDKFPQIKEDFERIQIVNGEVLQAAAPDAARIAEAAEEVRRRAARLRSNLFPAESKEKTKSGEDKDRPDLKSLLSALDLALTSFVNSPIFQNTKVVDPRDSEKARRDLDEVIKLSTRIVKETGGAKTPGGN